MNKELKADIIVVAVLLIGSIVQFVRGKKVFAWIGLVLGLLYLLLVISAVTKSKKK